MAQFGVQLEIYQGPLDLLLYLVRKHELDIVDIPIAMVTEQFLHHLTVLREIDVNAVGDFVEMASTLIELKSRMVLPHGDEVDEQLEDPRSELVERLLAYKSYCDAASMLQERGQESQRRYARVAGDLPQRKRQVADQPIREVELWDLVSALGRVLRENRAVQPANIVYDETPIQVYMERIYERVRREGSVRFIELFEQTVHKSTVISVFLAILELVRHQYLRAQQEETFAQITLEPGSQQGPLKHSGTENYQHGAKS